MSTFRNIIIGAKLGFKYGPTIEAGLDEANSNPKIVAAIKAAYDALAEFHAATATVPPVAPADPLPSIPAADAIAELSKEVQIGPDPEGPGNPQI